MAPGLASLQLLKVLRPPNCWAPSLGQLISTADETADDMLWKKVVQIRFELL